MPPPEDGEPAQAALLHGAPCALFAIDGTGLIRTANDTLLAWLDRRRDEVVGRLRFHDLLTPGGRVYAETHLLPMLRIQGGFREIAVTLNSPYEANRSVLVSARLAGIPGEPEPGAYFALFQAEHRRAYERELVAMRTAAQTRASWLQQVETMAGIGAWMLDLGTRNLSWSDQVYHLHDLPAGTPVTRRLALSFYKGAVRTRIADRLRETMETGAPFLLEAELTTALGRRRVVRARAEAEWEFGRVQRVLGIIQDITEQHEVERQLWRSAHIDELSGLANRRWFHERLEEKVRAGAGFVLLLLDLDDFKAVNDTHGHQAGDEVIRVMGERLKDIAGEAAVLGRLGGDEFGILLPGAPARAEVRILADAILDRLAAPIPLGRDNTRVAASIGLALFPEDADSGEGLVRCADTALYQVKRSGRAAAAFLSRDGMPWAEPTPGLVGCVRDAARAGRIVAVYQPKVGLRDGRIAGYEALARIVGPDGTLHGPDRIAAALDDPDCARLVDRRVLEAVLRDLAPGGALCGRDLPVGFNVSDHSLREPDYVDRLLSAMRARAVPPALLEVEVLETVLFGQATERLTQAFGRLRAAGLSVALDDFGTGFASLVHLRDLPIRTIKLDRAFVPDPAAPGANHHIVRAVVDLSHALGLHVVAEGIETSEARDLLAALGCDTGQGFLFGQPQRAEDLPLPR